MKYQQRILSCILFPALFFGCADDPAVVPDSGMADSRAADNLAHNVVKWQAGYQKPSVSLKEKKVFWKELYNDATMKVNAVWGVTANDMYAVGSGGLIMHYDGKTWQYMQGVNHAFLMSTKFHGVCGTNTNNVYVISDYDVIYFDGIMWRKSKWIWGQFFAIWGSSMTDMWVTSSDGMLWSHGARNDWDLVMLPKDMQANYYAIYGFSSGEIFVAGENGKMLKGHDYKFTRVETGTTENIRALWGTSPKDLYAAGDNGLLMHYDGQAWQRLYLSNSYFKSISGSSSGELFVVGHPWFKSDESVLHFSGGKWKREPPPVDSFLNAVIYISPSDIYAFGDYNGLKYINP